MRVPYQYADNMAEDEAKRKRSFFEMLYLSEHQEKQDLEDDGGVRNWLENSTRYKRPSSQRPSSKAGHSSQRSSSQRCASQRSSSAPIPSQHEIQAVRTPMTANRIPDLMRSDSAPISSTGSSTVIKETPMLPPCPRSNFARKGTPLAREVTFVEETPVMAGKVEPTAVKKPTFAPTGDINMLGKRKRDSLVMVPENRRIFSGFYFYYFPNNDIAPARKARIRKARDHGATWMHEFSTEVTHLIVDNGLTYVDVAKFIKPLPGEGLIIVNENYPLDCIQYLSMLDHAKGSYLVPGCPKEVDAVKPVFESNTTTEHCGKSLQLKPGRWDIVQQSTSTTSPSEESSPRPNSVSRRPPVPLSKLSKDLEDLSPLEGEPVAAKHQDALDEIISETKNLEYFLDDDDVEAISDDDSSDDGQLSPERKPKAARRKKSSANVPWQENFSCMKEGTGESSTENPNAHTIDILQQMADYYERMKDTWRPMAYRKVITTLKNRTNKISTYEEAFALPFVGHRLAEKIEEIVRTNRLRRLDHTKLEPTDLILQSFMKIYGVAHAHASKWIASGYTTFSDLLEKAPLTVNQKLGIERYDDFLKKIPRDEVIALGDIVKETSRRIDSAVNIIIGGSYRRGAKESGDIDIVVSKPDASIGDLKLFLDNLVSALTEKKFLVAALAVSRKKSGSKWHGCCILPGQEPPIWRRIDFLLVPSCELGAALIYFTGNDIFNRSIRLLASKKGMRLNQRGLYKDVMRGPGRVKLNEGVLVESKDEKKIFEILGVPWRKPEDRIC